MQAFNKHRKILWALIMRELSTRYGRNNIGFLWLLGEPIIFATGVAIFWAQVRPPYENGIKLIPFITSGYLPLILVRHLVGYTVGAVKNNSALLFHRMITPMHLVLSRLIVEFVGVTLAAIVIIFTYNIIGVMGPPMYFSDMIYVYAGWFLLGWLSAAMAMAMAALAEIFEFMEKVVQVVTYILVPLSGAFLMASSLPPKLRSFALSIPFIHEFEVIRRGYFGPSVAAIYDLTYATVWCVGLTVLALMLMQFVRSRIEVD